MQTPKIALAAALAMGATPVRAEEAPKAEGGSDTTFTLGEIVVTANRMAGSTDNVLTSVDRLGGDVAQRANVNYAWELVGRLPGVLVTNFNQGATSGKFSFRGFNGEGEINAVKLLIDGIPSNSNDGNMPYIDQVFPLDIAGIEVVRGTSDPRYGLHTIAGSADIKTRIGSTYADARLAGGSFGTYEGQLSAGLETGKVSQNYLVAYRKSDGYRRHGDLDRLSLAGKWFFNPNEDVRIGAIARYYKSNAQEPGYLTFADSRSDPRMTNAYNASDGDKREIQQYSLHFDNSLTDMLDFTAKAYFNRFRDDRYVKFSAGAAQQRRVTNEDHWGVMGALHYHTSLAGMPLMAEVGGDTQWQDDVSLRYTAVNRVPTAQTRDQRFKLSVGGVYGQLILEPAPWLRITPAWRWDWVGGSFLNRLTGRPAPINDYGTISQPKLSVALNPLKGLTVYGNYGKSFQIGLASGAYLIPPRTINLDPSINEGWELGVKYALGEVFEGRVAAWEQTATGEIKRKLNDPLGDSENVGATRRHGFDLQLSGRPVTGLSLWGALTWQKAIITTPDPATPQYKGNEIDHVPHWLWSGGVDFTGLPKVRLSLWANGQSSYWLTSANSAANGGKFGNYTMINAEVAYTLNDQIELALSAKNLADTFYEYAWWDGAQTLHSPGDGLNVTGSVRVRF
ncbi:TonB-dependent receptor [Novosphingobium sp. MW5]|nr:TonB-dependent receptor [Novosphingobium sp. MW5]